MHACDVKGRVHSLETFGLVDGPGVRFVVFLQGCHMRCQYCHNPETWDARKGEEWDAKALFDRAWRYRRYWGKNGGLTVSGGEPLVQLSFVTELFRQAKAHGVHTTLDTCGQPFRYDLLFLTQFDSLLRYTDLVMLDLKEMDEEKHRALTGHGNQNIRNMASYLSDHNTPMWIRHVLVPGLTDDEDGLRHMNEFIGTLRTVERVEVLPYHTLGTFKWKELGIPYLLEGVRTPTDEEVKRAEELLQVSRYLNRQDGTAGKKRA